MEKIYCTTNEYSGIWEGNVCNISIDEFLCKIYNDIFQLGIIFSKSFNLRTGNLSIKNCPNILYGHIRIEGSNFNSFFKRLTKIDSKLEANDFNDINLSEADILYFEKMILIDLQAQINLYTYLKFFKSLNFFHRFFRFLLQPINHFYTSMEDDYNIKFITRNLDISDQKEVNKFIEFYFIR